MTYTRPRTLAFLLLFGVAGSYLSYYLASNNSEILASIISFLTILEAFYAIARVGSMKDVHQIYKVLLTLTCFMILALPTYIFLGSLVMLFMG